MLLFCVAEAKRGAGPYLGGGYGSSTLKDDRHYDLKEDTSNGYVLYAGAYINDYLSVELEYVGGLQYTTQNTKQLDFSFSDVNTQAHYPFSFYNEAFDLYAKFGAGYVSLNGTGHTLVYGAGASYRVNDRYAVRFGYDYFNFGIDETGNSAADKKIAVEYFFGSIEVQF